MNLSLDFERPILALEAQIQALRMSTELSTSDLMAQIGLLEQQCQQLTEDTFSQLSIWQTVQLARHELRPQFMDYVSGIFSDFEELHGDRHFADDQAIVGGLARLEDRPVMLIGTQKGKDTKERTRRNFGMPRPEGYRKAMRLMQMAEKFGLPIITLVDTAGAYPGIDAEERNQSEAIARNLLVMARLKTPIVSIITGEGGSGGALALSVADHLAMLQYSVYSVISPEGCASILWRTKDKAPSAAQAMGMSASKIMEHKLIDCLIPEPLGGAHRNVPQLMRDVKSHLISVVGRLSRLSDSERLERRYEKLMRLGSNVIREN